MTVPNGRHMQFAPGTISVAADTPPAATDQQVPMSAASLRQTVHSHLTRAHLCRTRGRYDEAERELRTALRLAERDGEPESVELADAASALGIFLEALGKPAEAEGALRLAQRVYERTCGPGHPRLAEPLSALGAVCQLHGDLGEAERLYQRALAIVDTPPTRPDQDGGPT